MEPAPGHSSGCAQGCGEVPAAGGSAGREEEQAGAWSGQGWPARLPVLEGSLGPAGTTEPLVASTIPWQVEGLGAGEVVPGLQMPLGCLCVTPGLGSPWSLLLSCWRSSGPC